MKKFVKSFLMAAAALMLFAGCSNLNDATITSADSGKAVIKIGIEGVSNSTVVNATKSRTINPAAIAADAAPSTFGKITLKGESENGDSISETDLDFSSGTSATFEISYDVWYLTLTAYSADSTPVPVLQGLKRVDMKNSPETTITFTLSAEGVTTAGAVSITGKITDASSSAVKYSAALYDLNTNEVINDVSATPAPVSVDDADVSDTHGFAFNKSNIAPGRYNFRIYFYNSEGKKIGTWGDVVVIAPGRTTTFDKDLGDILYKAPVAPEDLAAYYVKNSVSGNDYQVLITWTDTPTNEEYFELTIQDVTDAAHPVDYKIFGDTTDNADPHVQEVFWGSSSYVDGTLSAGSNHCIVKLPLSKKFEISLKAVNFVGSSQACPRGAASAAYTSDEFDVPANEPYGDENINLMRITYDFDGGILKTSATTSVTGSLKEYHIFKDAAITLKTIEEAGSTSYPQLVNGSYPFNGWKNSAGTAVTTVSEFGNTTVTASYDSTVSIDYSIIDSYDSITVTAKVGDTNVKNGTLPNSNASIKIEWEDDDVVHVKVEVLQLNSSPVTVEGDVNGSSKQIVFNKTNHVAAGTHQVVVYATKSDGNIYADTFTITKER